MKQTTKKKPTKKIVQSGADADLDHREDFKSCTGCDHEMKHNQWMAAAVVLVLEPQCYKAGCVSVVSECPKCFTKSWVHVRFSSFPIYEEFSKEWQKAVKERSEMLLAKAETEWKQSLCSKCVHMEGKPHEYNNWRSCKPEGIGSAETECDSFSPKPPTP